MDVKAEFVPDQAKTEAVEAHVIWMTTGLSCDGDSVAMTSAVNPSLEDIVTQAIPGMPKVIVHNPVLAYENGPEFIEYWWRAERGEARSVRARGRGFGAERGPLGEVLGRDRQRPGDRGSRSRPTSGSTAWRRRRRPSSRWGRAPPTAASRR